MKEKAFFSDSDRRHMRCALELADGVKGRTFPNPAVGAVVVAVGGEIVGEGATNPPGGMHAEVAALSQAKERARGGVLYVTLEPCCHVGRTAPCTDAIIAAGIARVVSACRDPNPRVAGKGWLQLRSAGIKVETGLFESQAHRINEDYFYYIVKKRAWVTLKLAVTLDGRIADANGDSRWITEPATRTFVHDLRRRHAGVAVGRGTVEKDDPALTVRRVEGASPVRFIFSSCDSLAVGSTLARTARKIRTVVVVNDRGAASIQHSQGGWEVWYTGRCDAAESMRRFLRMAYEQGIGSVLFEGGSRLASFLMEYRFVNRLYLCYGNKILGDGVLALAFKRSLKLCQAISLDEIEFTCLGRNVVVTGIPRWR